MRAVKSKDTKAELSVRRMLFTHGYRYRIHDKRLPGKPDIVFSRRRKAIFVHGCFWHQHPGCPAAHRPASNLPYWNDKLDKNEARDHRNISRLDEAGWQALIVWECEIKQEETLSRRLSSFLGPPKTLDQSRDTRSRL
jgi:DNA mismatch endonuclease (patch repair protein)